jgi:UDP-glucose 6-dehydrogenase
VHILKIALIGKTGRFPCKELLDFQKAGHEVLYTGVDNEMKLSAGKLPGVKHAAAGSDVIVLLSDAFYGRCGEADITLLLKVLWSIAASISDYKLIILDNHFPEGLRGHIRSFLTNNLSDATARFDIVPSAEISRKGAALVKKLEGLNIPSCFN